ncbi:hypothetical protein V7100_03885 [Priestia megaterium]|uniref:hypothetical protein n=1 Tax=Priestia megaterium TaxID=1404 RepID=UPI002FFED97C
MGDINSPDIDILESEEININSYRSLVVANLSTGIDDWTSAITKAIADANPGDTLVLPNSRQYGTSSSIVVNKAINITGGGVIVSHHDGIALLFKPTLSSFGNGSGIVGADRNRLDVDISVVKKTKDWNDNSVGIQIVNSYYGVFNFPKILDFTTGLILTAEKVLTNTEGSAYNTFNIGTMKNHRYGILLRSRIGVGWVTENSFYGGSLGNGYQVPADNYQVFLDGDSTGWNNNNKFYNFSFEGFYTNCIKGTCAYHNYFYTCRYEMPNMVNLVDWDITSQANGLHDGLILDQSLTKIKDNGRYNRITSVGYSTGYVEYFDREFFSFIPRESEIKPIKGSKVTPVGNKAQKILNVSDGIVTLDLSVATDFYIVVFSDITSITFINQPTNFRGMECMLHFSQNSASGFTISGFPSNVKFGTKSTPPTKRAWGVDIYSLKNYTSPNLTFAVLSQYSS